MSFDIIVWILYVCIMDIILVDLMLYMHPVNRLIRIESGYSGNLISVTPDITIHIILTNSANGKPLNSWGVHI